MEIVNSCMLEDIKKRLNCSVNLMFSDLPYFLGTEWHFVNGILQMRGQGKDFMNKWGIGNADWWREYFKELYRVMKYGGYVVFYSINRQAGAFWNLMTEAGFETCEDQESGICVPSRLKWATISNFPKSTDASKAIDRALGLERSVIKENPLKKNNSKKIQNNAYGVDVRSDLTAPASSLATVFSGYKYGKAPLKKITEPLLVFRKAPKNKAVLNDLLAYQNDPEISPAVLDIENNRVGTREEKQFCGAKGNTKNAYGDFNYEKSKEPLPEGRFPCTLILSPEAAEVLDSQLDKYTFELNGKIYQNVRKNDYLQIVWKHTQNGTLQNLKVWEVKREVLKNGGNVYEGVFKENNTYFATGTKRPANSNFSGDSGYLSRVMHQAGFTQDEYDSYVNALNAYNNGLLDDTIYHTTVSPKERNKGCKHLLYKGLQHFQIIKKTTKQKTKIDFQEIQTLDPQTLTNSKKDQDKAFAKIFYELVNEASEEEINDTNFVDIAIQISQYESELGSFIYEGSNSFKINYRSKECLILVENVIRNGNGHPTLKPIALNKRFLSLFRLPKGIKQVLYIPCSGSGSEVIAAIQAGFDPENIISVEQNPDYIEIQKARLAYYNNIKVENVTTNIETKTEAKPKELSLF